MNRFSIFVFSFLFVFSLALSPNTYAACGGATHFIHQIQGAGDRSEFRGDTVTIEGVVVGVFLDDDELNGFFVQEEDGDADADPATSEGVFIFDGNFDASVSEGQLVAVTGEVDEFNGVTQIDSLTEVADCGTATATPATISLPVNNLDEWEQYEGMSVQFSQQLVVTEVFLWGRFGQVTLASERLMIPTHAVSPGDDAQALQELNLRNQIVLDDGSARTISSGLPAHAGEDNTIRVGDSITGLTGVLHYSFDVFRIHATGSEDFVRSNPRASSPPDVGGRLKVASFNVLNYFTTLDTGRAACGPTGRLDCRGAHSEEELARQTSKIVSALTAIDADIVGLMEIENDDDTTLNHLVDALNSAMGSNVYQAIETGTIGTDAIKVAVIYKPAAVNPVGNFAILDSSVDVEFLDDRNRPSLIQTFEETASGRRLTIAVNHFKSKGSNCANVRFNGERDIDTGDGQGNCNLTRTKAAQALVDWLATDPTGSSDPDFLLIGDFNAYRLEDPIMAMRNAGYRDLVDLFGSVNAYSYVFRGQSGYLDHALSNATLTPQVAGVAEWHINADEPPAKDYNDDVSDAGESNNQINLAGLYSPDAFRSSDHDPIIIGLNLSGPLNTSEASDESASTNNEIVSVSEGTDGIPMWYLVLAALMAAALILTVITRE